MELPRIKRNQIKSEIYSLRLNPTQKEMIIKAAQVNKVNHATVVRSAINSFFKIDD